MTASAPKGPLPLSRIATFAATAAAVFVGVALWRGSNQLVLMEAATRTNTEALQQVLGEVTRLRIEQSAGSKGPQALLEKLRTYAPLLSDARTTDPDHKNAKKEMQAILRAFGTLGKDGWKPIQDRLAQLKPEKDFDEIKQLLDASVAVDHDAGVKQLKAVLLGHQLPSPRLRWYAADRLIDADRPLAQATLKQVLRTESSKGFNPDRAAPGATIPDVAALSQNGFSNFVVKDVASGDADTDETLLMLIGRSEHDRMTVQECIEALGERGCSRAVPVIEKLFKNPPLQQQDPLFLGHCLDALVDIQGAKAKPFLEQELPTASSDTVAKKIQFLLNKIANGVEPKLPPPAATTEKAREDGNK